jgi:hypothetical protein
MELAAAILVAGPVGYFAGRRALAIYLALWAVIFPIQTVVVHSDNADDIGVSYFVLNAAILVFGIGMNRLGAWLRNRRSAGRGAAGAPAS